MKSLPNDIVLRPRFEHHLNSSKEILLANFEKVKKPPFLVKRIDDHLFIRFEQGLRTFWTPELHLELHDEENNSCRINGLFGPSPTLWTFFMFLHFGVATLYNSGHLGLFQLVFGKIHRTTNGDAGIIGSGLGLALCLWQNRKKKRRAPNEGALFFYDRGHQPLIIDCIRTVLIG